MVHDKLQFLVCGLLLASGGSLCRGEAITYLFGRETTGVRGLTDAQVVQGGVTMSLSAGPAGAVFDERTVGGLGINSRTISGVSDQEIDKFNFTGGTQISAESMTFSFDRAGKITELNFDGVKDESFEFFRLETPSGEVLSIFDSQIGLRLVDLSLISEPNLTLLTEGGGADDDLFDLEIPFAAGEEFRLIYGEHIPNPSNYQPGFTPEAGNGARFTGVTITPIPEPAALLLALLTISLCCSRRF